MLPKLRLGGDFIVKPDAVLGPREIEDYEIVYFPEGGGSVYRVGDREWKLDKGSLVLTRPGVAHEYRFDKEKATRHWFIHFRYDRTPPELAVLREGGPDVIRLPAHSAVPVFLQTIFRNAHRRGDSDTAAAYVSLLLHAALTELQLLEEHPAAGRNAAGVPAPLEAAKEYMRSRLGDADLTIHEIARASGWSHEHFSRQFSKHFGMPPREALLRMRIERASGLLVSRPVSVGEAAEMVGIRDPHYFSRAFRRITGFSATEYRVAFAHPINRYIAAVPELEGADYPVNHYFLFRRP